MLADRAHVRLAGDSFLIDETQPGHYIHRFIDLVPERDDVPMPGAPRKNAFMSDSLYWTYDDWAGGEGNRQWYEEDYDMYKVGWELNPRIRGRLTGRPNRTRISVDGTDVRDRNFFTIGVKGRLWMAGGIDLFYSTAPQTSFTQVSDANDLKIATLSSSYKITALAANERWCFVAAFRSNAGNPGTRVIRAVDYSGNDSDILDEVADKPAFIGMCIFNGRLWAWTGARLISYDIDSVANGGTANVNSTVRYSVGSDIVSALPGSGYFGGCFTAENSIIMWYAEDMQTYAYEYKKGVGRPIWKLPHGYTAKDAWYQDGVVYFSGHWDSDDGTAGYGELKALVLENYRPLSLKWVRKTEGTGTKMNLAAGSPSYARQNLMCATHTGRIFVYDAETDGLTMLDQLSRSSGSDPDGLTFTSADNRIGDTITYGSRRVVAVYRPGAGAAGTENYQVVTYDDDEQNQIELDLNSTDWTGYNGYFESSAWDYGYPMELKSLIGFHLTFKPLVSGQTIDVSYDLDGTGSFTALTQVTSATSGASAGRVFIPVATTSAAKKFFSMAYRVKLASQGDAVAVPILYAVTAEAKLTRKREEWVLRLRLKNELSNTRVKGRKDKGSTIRDNILDTVKAGVPVEFLDGYRYDGEQPRYSTHTVIIKEAEDEIDESGEGICTVRLVATSEAT